MLNQRKGDLCPICEEGHLKEEKRDLSFTYKGRAKVFEAQKVLTCSVCLHEVFPKTTGQNIERKLADFRRVIDGLLTCSELRETRKYLGLNKKKMANLLSVDAKTVGRYENGKVVQGAQVDKLYRMYRSLPSSAIQLAQHGVPFDYFRIGAVVSLERILPYDTAATPVLARKGKADSSSSGLLPGTRYLGPSTNTAYIREDGLIAA